METDEERDLHSILSAPHLQKLLSVHDIVRSRSYEAPVPQFDPTWHPQTNYDRHGKRGRGKGPEYRNVGLHKSANEPLVSGCGLVVLLTWRTNRFGLTDDIVCVCLHGKHGYIVENARECVCRLYFANLHSE